MYDHTSSRVLRWLRVPPEPHAPHGDPASLKVFRAGKNYFRLRLFSWSFAQLLALAGIVFWAVVFIDVEVMARARKAAPPPTAPALPATPLAQPGQAPAPASTPAQATGQRDWKDKFAEEVNAVAKNVQKEARKPRRNHANGWEQFKLSLVQLALVLPDWAFPLLWALKILGFILYLVQIPITYAVRLDYELRWYMVTDRSLRIRHGVWKVSESTMSFANIQQVIVSQGPLQRALGLSDVRVQSAGGGNGGTDSHGNQAAGEDMHTGLFHSVTNASEIRDLILERLRHFRESGLGDPDEKNTAPHATPAPAVATVAGDTLAAARELAAEARALRVALS